MPANTFATGIQTIVATYSGTTTGTLYATSSATLSQSVNVTTTTVISGQSPTVVGQSVTYTGTVTSSDGTTPTTGSITFLDGGIAIVGCTSVNVNSFGQATCTPSTYTTAGSRHTITATYSGSPTYTASGVSSPITQVVDAAGTTTVVVSTTGSPSVINQGVTYTATVGETLVRARPRPATSSSSTAAPPSADAGGVALSGSAVATCVVTYAAVGSHTITAQYLGSTNFASSAVSTAITQVVDNATTTVVVSSANPSVVGQTLVYTASVTSSTSSAPTARHRHVP